MTPPQLALGLHSLPPILHMTVPSPIPGYSKAPRGLFVLPRVARVFTGTAISPSPPPRQWPSRSTIHAGRNLPDKGLRYLRTVRVTAAVHRGFSLGLAPRPLTFRHWAGVSLYTWDFPLAQTCVFVKQSPGLLLCAPRELHQLVISPPGGPFIPKLQGPFV
jgi:hypothetical protein